MWTWTSALFLLLFYSNRCVLSSNFVDKELYEGSSCELKNGGGKGVCVKATDCPERLEEIKKSDYSSDDRCGFEDFDEIYCCAKPSIMKSIDQLVARPAETACRNYKRKLEELKNEEYSHVPFSDKIVARVGEFPYMVAVGYAVPEVEAVGGVKYVCGGTLISEKHVLTAAHCLGNIDGPTPVQVLLGANDLDDLWAAEAQRVPISRITKHPKYKKSLNYHDLAILELRDPVEFTIDVHPACLMSRPLSRITVRPNTSLVILGWGDIDLDGTTTTKLLKDESFKIMNKNTCCKWYEHSQTQTPNGLDNAMICVRDLDATRRADTCWADGGGPLLISSAKYPFLVGVMSFGQACGGTAPGVYVSVYKYLNWIEDQVWPNTN